MIIFAIGVLVLAQTNLKAIGILCIVQGLFNVSANAYKLINKK